MMDMFEGKTPYRTRYCLPDYEPFPGNREVSFNAGTAKGYLDAVETCSCLYHRYSMDGGLAVYIGCLDHLLEPLWRMRRRPGMPYVSADPRGPHHIQRILPR